MDMNNIRTESHVAQKNRRHKLRFQQNSDDPTHQHVPQDPRSYGSISYDPNVFPSEMLNSIASNPHLLLPQNHAFVSHNQDSGAGLSPASFKVIGDNPTISSSGNWKNVVSAPNQVQVSNDWNVVSYSNVASHMMVDYHHHQHHHQGLQNIHLNDHKNYGDVVTFGSSPYNYQNTLQDVVTTATVGTHVHQSIPCWMNASEQQLGFIANRHNDHRTNENNNCITQALSLSLSSVPQAKTEYPNLQSGSKGAKTDLLANPDGKLLAGTSSFAHRNVGPLGPFTGYATILKNSKYLKPAQELLNDNCNVGGQELVQTCENTRNIFEEEMSRVSGEPGPSSSTIYGSNEHGAGNSSTFSESYRPEFHQKKAKLLYMQEEVCRRYKQYHQQMQMVISSFETVAGLTTATPYVSLALKSVSRHFHFVKNAISEQLTQMKKAFEDLCSPSRTFDPNASDSLSQLKSMDRNLQRHGKASGGSGFFGNQQAVWRPQRGLPERAVSVLKAWLFDHFLHPYPSDADKHMLATQTGLTRNQVSNWFINARVRIWKPMVEEIHTLETKGLADSNTNNPPTDGQDTSPMDMSSLSNKQQAECSRNSGNITMINDQNEPNNEQLWDHETRSRVDYQINPVATMDQSFTNVMPYPRNPFEAGGVVPVSLTLGLRQNAENVQQMQQHEHQFRQRFGGQLIHDFAG
ncbi:BEL1-like homeodomain protein 8 [Rutidosis leptorrhynchoides]|uniref:BEL1-like homeodomain protein 8 n=1 Tax=Rutidosis leptorrhynchoides TaxID=125765 RepID=UPI003A994506